MFINRKTLTSFAAAAFIITGMGTAVAQLNNKPYSFRNSPGGGPGMSPGGKQAIIDEELFDKTPDNLQRTFDGHLVDIVEGPGNTAITFRKGTDSSVPGFKGTSFRGTANRGVGVFNTFFAPSSGDSFTYHNPAQYHSAATISSWTLNITIANGPYPQNNRNSVDSWTAFVNSLNKM